MKALKDLLNGVKKMKIPIARTNLLKHEKNSVLDPLESGWIVQGPKVEEFEKKWSDFTNSNYSIALTSCTSGLHLSLAALGFGPGDEAIVPAFTWISTANVVEHMGGKVLFCDIDLNTFNIDANKIEELINPNVKVILPVHLFGLSANMNPILQIAKKHNLKVIEDAACGFGSKYENIHVGNFGDVGVFSFHPRKAITTGEGGMVTTNNKKLAEKIRCLRDHGAMISDRQRHLGPRPYLLADHPEAGYNQRMTDLQGALGSSQMDRAEEIVIERRKLAENYNKAFRNLKWLKTPTEENLYHHGYQSYPCLFLPGFSVKSNQLPNITEIKIINEKRNYWMEDLLTKGIGTRPATHAVHMLSYYKNKYKLKSEDFYNSFIANDCSISLPLFHGMKPEEQEFVINSVQKAKF